MLRGPGVETAVPRDGGWPRTADWAEQELDRARQLAESVLTPGSLAEWEKRLGLRSPGQALSTPRHFS